MLRMIQLYNFFFPPNENLNSNFRRKRKKTFSLGLEEHRLNLHLGGVLRKKICAKLTVTSTLGRRKRGGSVCGGNA